MVYKETRMKESMDALAELSTQAQELDKGY